ncbi:MAG: CHAT domain-containing protein [Cyanobacteria bacterium P01_D01_bin.44]
MNFISQIQGPFRLSVVTLVIWSLLRAEISQAQITPASDGTGTRVTSQDTHFDVEGGTRAGSNLFHSFDQFDLDAGQVADFGAGTGIQNILGRVIGGEASIIDGLIQVTGGNANLYLINSAGILFGPNAALNVPAAFTATTADSIGFETGLLPSLGNADYQLLIGDPTYFDFTQPVSGSLDAILVNQGNLAVGNGQSLALLGHRVLNTGQLIAPEGNITVAASAGQLQIRQAGSLLSLAGPESSLTPTELPGWLTGEVADHATTISVSPEGQIQLTGAELPLGAVQVSGSLDASGQTGGKVQVLGQNVALVGATVNASGITRGGSALIGGDYQGGGTTPTAAFTSVDQNSQLTADAQRLGDAGQVVVWADGLTQFLGEIRARGGAQGGNGGNVEISGKESLIFEGRVDLSAVQGEFGTLLLDPFTIEIRSGDGTGTNDVVLPVVLSNEPNDSGGIFVIYETTLEDLAGDANVILQATHDIIIQDLADNELTFQPGTGSITFLADADGNNGGQFLMVDLADVLRTPGRNVSISGASVTTGTINTGIESLITNTDSGGDIELIATNDDLQTQDLLTSSRSSGNNSGNGGAIVLNANNNITVGNFRTSAEALFNNSGKGGDIIARATNGSIIVGDIYARARAGGNNDGNAGSVSLEALNSSTTTNSIVATTDGVLGSDIGYGGDVFLSSLGDIQVAYIHTDSDQNAGVINISTEQSFRAIGDASNLAGAVVSLSAVGGGAGRVNIEYSQIGEGIFTVGDSSANGTNGGITTGANSLNPVTVIPGNVDNGTLRITNNPDIPDNLDIPDNPDILGALNLPPDLPESSDARVSEPAPEDQQPQPASSRESPLLSPDLARIQVPVTSSSSDDDAAAGEVFLQGGNKSEDSAFWSALESSMSEEFADYLELSTPAKETSLEDVANVLTEVKSASDINSALVYAYFEDEQLEVMLITAEGNPIRHRVEGATREKVEQMAQTFLQSVTNPVLRPAQYLQPAQQLHQWLIEPLSNDLQAQDIQNLAFILAPGLRSLPLAALHDGEKFLVESYSLGLMPTFGLTDLRQLTDQQLDDISVLGMGISDFQDQVDLFAVPAELENITQETGQHFLNEEVTLKNLQTQLRDTPFEVLHIATHALFKPGARENSYLQLWDQQLQLDQLRELDLAGSNVALIVLSACTTALGDQEAEFGFAGFAVNSGAQSALASLWSVSDEATLGFMTTFYDHLAQSTTRSEALRQTQIQMLRGDLEIVEGVVYGPGSEEIAVLPELAESGSWDFAHPSYWAAFMMIGNPW